MKNVENAAPYIQVVRLVSGPKPGLFEQKKAQFLEALSLLKLHQVVSEAFGIFFTIAMAYRNANAEKKSSLAS